MNCSGEGFQQVEYQVLPKQNVSHGYLLQSLATDQEGVGYSVLVYGTDEIGQRDVWLCCTPGHLLNAELMAFTALYPLPITESEDGNGEPEPGLTFWDSHSPTLWTVCF